MKTHARSAATSWWVVAAGVVAVAGVLAAGSVGVAQTPATAPSDPREHHRPDAKAIAEATAFAEQALAKPMAAVDFEEQPLETVVDWIRDVTDMNINVNWAALEASGVAKDAPVTLHLRKLPGKRILTEVLKSAAGQVQVAFVLDDGVVCISTKEDLASQQVTRAYDVRELFSKDRLDVSGYVDDEASQLATQISGAVDSPSWRDGGGSGTITVRNGQLVVTQSAMVQAQVAEFLATMREAAVPAWQDQIRKKLQTVLDVQADAATVSDVVKLIRERCDVNLAEDPALAQAQLPTMKLSLKKVTAQQVLLMMADMTRTQVLLKNGAVYVTKQDLPILPPGMMPPAVMPPVAPSVTPGGPGGVAPADLNAPRYGNFPSVPNIVAPATRPAAIPTPAPALPR